MAWIVRIALERSEDAFETETEKFRPKPHSEEIHRRRFFSTKKFRSGPKKFSEPLILFENDNFCEKQQNKTIGEMSAELATY